MMKLIKYKDKLYYLGFFLDIIMQKVNHIFHVEFNSENDKVYKLTFMTNEKSNNKYAIDIYINYIEKRLLFETIQNILNGDKEVIELTFSNKIDCHNRVYYKLSQFVNTECLEFSNITILMKLKIYRDKNFVIIEPKVSYSYLPITMKDLDTYIYPVLLSENTINEIKSNYE